MRRLRDWWRGRNYDAGYQKGIADSYAMMQAASQHTLNVIAVQQRMMVIGMDSAAIHRVH